MKSRDVIGHVTIKLPGVDFSGWSIVTMRLSCTVMEIWRLTYWTHGRGHGNKDGEGKEKEGEGKERERKSEKGKNGKGEGEKYER